jgi:anthranilate phosphoribosyltransferase
MLTSLTPDRVDRQTFEHFVQAVFNTRIPIPPVEADVIDCCGTGGSGRSHYNTSTTVAFVLAAGGVPVVKFGNRGMTSRSGSFDFLEALGIPIETPLDRLEEILAESGVVFLFAPQCYPTLAKFGTLRRSLGVKTIFNFMGPLLHPMQPPYRLLGVSDTRMQAMMAEYLVHDSATIRALVVRGEETLDEITCDGESLMYDVFGPACEQQRFKAAFSGEIPPPDAVLTPTDNIAIFQQLVTGADQTSYYHRLVCLNAGAGFYVTGKTENILDGASYAEDLLAGGKVAETVERCRRAYAG